MTSSSSTFLFNQLNAKPIQSGLGLELETGTFLFNKLNSKPFEDRKRLINAEPPPSPPRLEAPTMRIALG